MRHLYPISLLTCGQYLVLITETCLSAYSLFILHAHSVVFVNRNLKYNFFLHNNAFLSEDQKTLNRMTKDRNDLAEKNLNCGEIKKILNPSTGWHFSNKPRFSCG
jgi:hypothetical protein